VNKNDKNELYVSHATFDNYIAMVRIFKNYNFQYTDGPLKSS